MKQTLLRWWANWRSFEDTMLDLIRGLLDCTPFWARIVLLAFFWLWYDDSITKPAYQHAQDVRRLCWAIESPYGRLLRAKMESVPTGGTAHTYESLMW
jgi:hypothetical protein